MFLLQEPPFKFLRGDAPGDAEAKSLLAFVFTFSQQLPAATGSSPASSERYIINEAREPKWTDVFLLFFNSLCFFSLESCSNPLSPSPGDREAASPSPFNLMPHRGTCPNCSQLAARFSALPPLPATGIKCVRAWLRDIGISGRISNGLFFSAS